MLNKYASEKYLTLFCIQSQTPPVEGTKVDEKSLDSH
jgi:hypothetical protein